MAFYAINSVYFFLSHKGFALGIAVKILFTLLQSKKIVTKSPPERPNEGVNNRTRVIRVYFYLFKKEDKMSFRPFFKA